MKKTISFLIAVSMSASAFAGTTYEKNPKAPVAPPPPAGCECFGPGFAFGLYGGALIPSSNESTEYGGGALVEYFFNDYVGIQGTYGVYSTNSEHHQFDGSLVLRYPIRSICIAPYIIGGGGGSTNADTDTDWHVGGGLEARFESANCLGLFADGAYHFTDDDREDYTIVRLGLKFKF